MQTQVRFDASQSRLDLLEFPDQDLFQPDILFLQPAQLADQLADVTRELGLLVGELGDVIRELGVVVLQPVEAREGVGPQVIDALVQVGIEVA